MSQSREKKLRRWFGLDQAPNPGGMIFENASGKLSGTIDFLPKAEREKEMLKFHQEGFRAKLAERIAYLPQKLDRAKYIPENALYRWRSARELSNARQLHFTSHHVHPVGSTYEIEGYFDLGNDLGYELSVLTSTAFKEMAEMDWQMGYISSDTHAVITGVGAWIISPEDNLDEATIIEAIERWYEHKFKWVKGHWSMRQQRLPEITLDLSWDSSATGALPPNIKAVR